MRIISFLFIVLISATALLGQSYRFTVDLVKVEKDRIKVICEMPEMDIQEGPLVYRMPKIVPGTYAIYDFGRFIHDFKAFDANGVKLLVKKVDANGWEITDGNQLRKISYWVEDTWDSEIDGPEVFEPGGSGFFKGKNFTMNTHCLFGFFEGHQEEIYEVKYLKPEGFYGTTSLNPVETGVDFDIFQTQRYFDLVDAPIMYNVPDTAMVNIGGAEIVYSVYSPNGYLSAAFIKKEVTKILRAQESYLGGKLPIKRYAFIIHLFEGFGLTGAYGALEHNYSSLYFLPETFAMFIAQSIRDIAAHEFFHIITPLNIHSEEIHNFDFTHPEMSRHLWLYEGVTEYSSHLVQVREGLVPLDGFLDVVKEKIEAAAQYNDTLPFTNMSQGCLDQYKDEYANVYEKGALIGMCLDILLLKQSGGKYSLRNLLQDLSKEYGKDKPFRDEYLFGKIEAMRGPAVGTFLRTYVGGPNPLPLTEYLAEVGIKYEPSLLRSKITMGGVDFRVTDDGLIEVSSTWEQDEFGDLIGYERYDQVYKFDNEKVSSDNFKELINDYFTYAEPGQPFEMVLKRKKGKRWKKIKVNVPLMLMKEESSNFLEADEEATEGQLQLRKAWLGNYLEK